jgi:ABC-type dipeptide/oligopeptide/nickel transport system permease component
VRQNLSMFVVKRLLAVVPILVGAVLFTFILMRVLPGDPASMLASGPGSGPDEVAAMRKQLGLDQPIAIQLVLYVKALLHGDLGHSFTTGDPVTADLLQRLPASLQLTLAAFLLTIVIAVPLGIGAALRPNSLLDHACRALAALGTALPTFVLGLALIYLFYYQLGWLPGPIGQIDPLLSPPPAATGFMVVDSLLSGDWQAFISALEHLILPAVTMALFAISPLARITRSAMLDVLNADFMRTARSLGLPSRMVIIRYGLRNASVSIVTTLGMIFSYMLGANVLVEKVFAWPGISSYSIDALTNADYAPVQGYVLVIATVFAGVNLMIDLMHGILDPQIRRRG